MELAPNSFVHSPNDTFEVVKPIGKGSFACAYLVLSQSDCQSYVDKVMDLSTMTPREVQDARREVTVLSQLDHPNITAYRESFQIDSSLHVIMEYADAGDMYTLLRERKKRSEYFSEDEIMSHFVQILLALHHLHTNHVLHRDLKTKNLFLTKKGLVKVGDFGIATVLTSTLAVAKTICGTPYYFSPELCQNRPYTLKSDVWAVGCVLYELAMLTYPFTGSGVRQLVGRILQGKFTPVSSERYSEELVALSQYTLTHDDSQRPSVAQLLAVPYVRKHIARLQAQLNESASAGEESLSRPMSSIARDGPTLSPGGGQSSDMAISSSASGGGPQNLPQAAAAVALPTRGKGPTGAAPQRGDSAGSPSAGIDAAAASGRGSVDASSVYASPIKGRKGLKKFLNGVAQPDSPPGGAMGSSGHLAPNGMDNGGTAQRDPGTVSWFCSGVNVAKPRVQLQKAAAQLGAALTVDANAPDGGAGVASPGAGADGGAIVDEVEDEPESVRAQVLRQIGEAKLNELVAVVHSTSGADARAGVAKVKQLMKGYPPSLVVLAVTVARSMAEEANEAAAADGGDGKGSQSPQASPGGAGSPPGGVGVGGGVVGGGMGVGAGVPRGAVQQRMAVAGGAVSGGGMGGPQGGMRR